MRFKVFAELSRIQVVGPLLDIHEVRPRAGLGDSLRGRDKSIRNRNNSIARLHSRGDQSKPQCVCAVPYAYAIFDFAKLCKLLFELFDHRSADESGALQRPPEDRNQFLFQFYMGSHQV